jgi:hypothetical protein
MSFQKTQKLRCTLRSFALSMFIIGGLSCQGTTKQHTPPPRPLRPEVIEAIKVENLKIKLLPFTLTDKELGLETYQEWKVDSSLVDEIAQKLVERLKGFQNKSRQFCDVMLDVLNEKKQTLPPLNEQSISSQQKNTYTAFCLLYDARSKILELSLREPSYSSLSKELKSFAHTIMSNEKSFIALKESQKKDSLQALYSSYADCLKDKTIRTLIDNFPEAYRGHSVIWHKLNKHTFGKKFIRSFLQQYMVDVYGGC